MYPCRTSRRAYLANHLLASGTSPSQGLIRDEMIQRCVRCSQGWQPAIGK